MAGKLKDVQVLITAGPTWEFLDDVRFLGNPSTGRMGLELAEAARREGAIVSVVCGPNSLPIPPGVHWVNVTSAQDMLDATQERFAACDVLIASAAVSDYRPRFRAAGKVKKGPKEITLELVKNPDVLKTVTRKRRTDQVVVGFSLEAANALKNARKKLEAKRCDLMVVNSPGHFGDSREFVRIINKHGVVEEVPPSGKAIVAQRIIALASAVRGREVLPLVERFPEVKS